MDTKIVVMIAAATLCTWAYNSIGQDSGNFRQGPPGGERNGSRPKPPIESALDVNSDGTLDANEIANASTALKSLDKNGDGQLTADELRPPMPPQQ